MQARHAVSKTRGKAYGRTGLEVAPIFGLVSAGTRTGTRHTGLGAPTDDALLVTHCGPHILLAIADGAGDPRATRSAEGAARAVATATAAANRSWPVYGADSQLLVEALAAAHVNLVGRAQHEGLDPAVFATTLTLVLLAGNRIVSARVGDGSLYTWDGKKLARFCTVPLPETATPMLTQPDWRTWMATADQERPFVQGLVLCSDGADDFFLDDAGSGRGRAPSASMFKGLSDFCDQYGPTAGVSYAMQMLNNPDWARRTGDDRSFIFALKPQSAKATPNARLPR
jgi:hypothetical protein